MLETFLTVASFKPNMETLSPGLILGIICIYFLLLLGISWWTSRGADSQTFFTANKSSPWILVAIGMIGASLSGVTFISLPGAIGSGGKDMAFSYMQMVFGYLLGYFVIAAVLMPLYYRLNLTSIYGYLESRFGKMSYKIGAGYFLLSRILGASFRLILVAIVLQQFVLGPMGIPFALTVAITIGLIWIYTFTGGIKTIVITDTLQTVFMLTAVVLTLWYIGQEMGVEGFGGIIQTIQDSQYSQLFFFEGGWADPNNFWKQFVSGALITIVMTGLDQDMMQKNLTCKSLGDAQKNIFLFSIILVFANMLFISLGAMLYIYADFAQIAIPERADTLYPLLALEHLPPMVGIVFILGLIAAAYSSADSALTSLTTAFCIDFLEFEKRPELTEAQKKKMRMITHVAFSVILFLIIIIFNALNKESILKNLFVMSGYTYGPLLGLYAFGILTKRRIKDQWSILVCILAPVISYFINTNSELLFNGFQFGYLNIALNGLLAFIGIWIISLKPSHD
jgi:SSS family transporter